jgi:hypothetical protein
MHIEQDVPEPRVGKDRSLHASLCPDEKRVHSRSLFDKCAGNCQRRVQVTAGPAAREDHSH